MADSAAVLRLKRERELLLAQGKLSAGDEVDKMITSEIESIEASEAQEWFKLAEGPGMSAVSLSGLGQSGIGYAPQRDITKTFPGAMSKEEEEYLLALRGPVPGMMTYKGIT